MIENYSDFNKDPHRVFANVILADGKIVNWKTGNTRWTKTNYANYSQPYIVYDERHEITIRSRSFVVKNRKQHNHAFETLAARFYSQFELYEGYSLAKPY